LKKRGEMVFLGKIYYIDNAVNPFSLLKRIRVGDEFDSSPP